MEYFVPPSGTVRPSADNLKMPSHESLSPVNRPSLGQRASSTTSLPRGSPSAGLTSTSHKGAPQRSHKVHTVGHNRAPHGRNPSYGKSLNKLSKLGQGNVGEGITATNSSHVQNPGTSPKSSHIKRNGSTISLSKDGSKVIFKRNGSNVSLKRNGSSSAFVVAGKPELSRRKSQQQQKSSAKEQIKSAAQFAVGSEGPDDDWTEDSNSQSPSTTRQSSAAPTRPQSRQHPTSDTLPDQILSNSYQPSSSGSSEELSDSTDDAAGEIEPTSQPPSASPRPAKTSTLTHRLRKRNNSSNAPPRSSVISGKFGSSNTYSATNFNISRTSTSHDLSLPADGVSRFLNPTEPASSNQSPDSIAEHLQTTLADLQGNQDFQRDRDSNTPSTGHSSVNGDAQRARSANHLGSKPSLNGENITSAIVTSPQFQYESALNGGYNSGMSRTQLKLNLQRMSSSRDPAHAPVVPPSLAMMHGPSALANMGAGGGMAGSERRRRLWEQAGLEYWNGRRYNNILANSVEKLDHRKDGKAVGKPAQKSRPKERDVGLGHSAGTIPEATAPGRGRVKFQIGSVDDKEKPNGPSIEVEGILRRMWDSNGSTLGEQ